MREGERERERGGGREIQDRTEEHSRKGEEDGIYGISEHLLIVDGLNNDLTYHR